MKKGVIKSVVKFAAILLIAIISTYYIYHKFQNDRAVDFNSSSLDVVYHDTNGDKITLTKVTPVVDAVGLSSKAYNLSIHNNLTVPVIYKIKIEDDKEAIRFDECGESLISHDNIKISIKVGRRPNRIYNLDELEDGILYDNEVKALGDDSIAIRVWVKMDTDIPSGFDMHYHGKIVVLEDGEEIAINK